MPYSWGTTGLTPITTSKSETTRDQWCPAAATGGLGRTAPPRAIVAVTPHRENSGTGEMPDLQVVVIAAPD